MPVRRYGKLVRDRIPEIIAAYGLTPVTRTLTGEDYVAALKAKLAEEAGEAAASGTPEALAVELADLLEVIRALAGAMGLSIEELEAIRSERARERGAFVERIFLVETH
ncbi:MAG: nucleoside triphosphate pyrophosphohydrolase [Chloroflexi bacterium]|nr:nucleoside triphosphate pyrophosphohydrolase [Chloroflexota bacterium]